MVPGDTAQVISARYRFVSLCFRCAPRASTALAFSELMGMRVSAGIFPDTCSAM
jgi:hypothetical protein